MLRRAALFLFYPQLCFFLPGVARTAVSCLLLVCDVNLASSVPGASFCFFFFFFIASSAGYLFAIHRSDLHPDDTLETRKGDKRWKRNTHIRRSIQTSVQSCSHYSRYPFTAFVSVIDDDTVRVIFFRPKAFGSFSAAKSKSGERRLLPEHFGSDVN